MISTNQSAVSGRIWTNRSGPLCDLVELRNVAITQPGVALCPHCLHRGREEAEGGEVPPRYVELLQAGEAGETPRLDGGEAGVVTELEAEEVLEAGQVVRTHHCELVVTEIKVTEPPPPPPHLQQGGPRH